MRWYTIRDKWVVVRRFQVCQSCRGEIEPGQHARHVKLAYEDGSGVDSQYTCGPCDEARNPHRGRFAA